MADQPKLLLVADTYYPKVDGTLKFIEEFMKRAQDSFEISLLVPDYGVKKGRNVTYIEPSKIIKMSDYPSIKFSFKNFSLIKKAVKEADIVFVQGFAATRTQKHRINIFCQNRLDNAGREIF